MQAIDERLEVIEVAEPDLATRNWCYPSTKTKPQQFFVDFGLAEWTAAAGLKVAVVRIASGINANFVADVCTVPKELKGFALDQNEFGQDATITNEISAAK